MAGFTVTTLADLRARALAPVGETDTDSFYDKALLNYWANDALKRWYIGIGDGVEDARQMTTKVGIRNYKCPPGFRKPALVLYNGDPLRHAQFLSLDFFSSGNSYVGWFHIFGWPEPELLLGPLPPSAAYDLTIYYYREPQAMVDDTDVPEMPAIFAHYLAYYMIAQIRYNDGDVAAANAMMADYNSGRDEFRRDQIDNSRSNYMSQLHDSAY